MDTQQDKMMYIHWALLGIVIILMLIIIFSPLPKLDCSMCPDCKAQLQVASSNIFGVK